MMTIQNENDETLMCLEECSKRSNSKYLTSYKRNRKRKMLPMRAEIRTKVNIRTNFLFFYTKQTITQVKIVLQRFLKVSAIKSLNGNLIHLLAKFQYDAEKSMFI